MTVFTCRDEAIAALMEPDADVRKAASVYLGEDGSDAAVQALVSALSSSHVDVQINAAEALGNCKNPAAVRPLAAVLRNNEIPASARQAAARSLGTLGHSEGVGPLIETIQEVLENPEHTDHNVVRTAVRALGILGPLMGDDLSRAKVVDGLLVLLDAHSAVLRQSAIGALAAYEDPRSVKPLREALFDESWLVRQAAVLALAEVGGSEVGPAVEGMMNDSNRNVRIAAADALETLTRLGCGE